MRGRIGIGILVVSACSGPTTTTSIAPDNPSTTSSTSSAALEYIDEALALAEKHSLRADMIDWQGIKEAAYERAAGAKTIEEAYAAVEVAVRLMDDTHAVFVSPNDVFEFQNEPADIEVPVIELREDRFGFVAAGQFIGDPGFEADQFAGDLASTIASHADTACGWIVDLRVTRFGIMEPVLAGLSPLLDGGAILGLTHRDGSVETFSNDGEGLSREGSAIVSTSTGDLAQTPLPVAVLIGSVTRHPGEAVALAFRGQQDTQFFGQPTAGETQWIDPLELSDGGVIAITTSNLTDRDGNVFGEGLPVIPDVEVVPPEDVEQVALTWLSEHPACQ